MENIFNYLLIGFMAVLGGVPTLYILISLPWTLGGKIYRKIKYGNSLYD